MAIGKRKVSEDEMAIDLTPMLDVVFIVLIFFIVTASFVSEKGLQINQSASNDQTLSADQEKRNIVLKVTQNNEIWLGDRRIDLRSVRANVGRLLAGNQQAKVIVQAHPKSKTEVFVKITDQAREAGAVDVVLAPY